jgi:hypothetical protein
METKEQADEVMDRVHGKEIDRQKVTVEKV